MVDYPYIWEKLPCCLWTTHYSRSKSTTNRYEQKQIMHCTRGGSNPPHSAIVSLLKTSLLKYFLIPYYQHEKTFIYRVCIEKILKEIGVCKLSRKVLISRQLLYQWMKIFVIHIRYLLTTLSRSLKLSLEYLINESLKDDLYERVNKMYFLKKIPT